MTEEGKENLPLNTPDSPSSKKEIRTKHRSKRNTSENLFSLSKQSAKNEDNAEVAVPRRPKKKTRPLREEVVDLTEDLSDCDYSTKETPSTDLPSQPLLSDFSKPVKQKSPHPKSINCKYCGATIDEVTKCSAPLEGAIKEKDMLNFPEIQSSWKISDELPCLKLVNFRVYDEARHLCPFDGRLMKSGNQFYFSGFVKPYTSEKTDLADLSACENMGPITSWWFEGFDLKEESAVGLTSDLAHYYLETPMSEYAPFMMSVKEKIFVAKVVIDILENVSDDEELSYESLLNSLKKIIPPEGVPAITETILLKNGVFVCEQIQSHDADADENEKLMTPMACIEELSRKVHHDFSAYEDDCDDSIFQVGEIERAVIDTIDLGDISSSEDNGDEARPRRKCRKYFTCAELGLLDEDEAETRRRGKRQHYEDLDYINDDDAERKCQKKWRCIKQQRIMPERRRIMPVRRRSPTRRATMPTKTPLVGNIFESFLNRDIMKSYTRNYSDTTFNLTANSMPYGDYNLKIPKLCLPKPEDVGVDSLRCEIRFAFEWSDEEIDPVSELEEAEKMKFDNEQVHENEKVKVERKDEQARKNEKKMEAEDALELDNEKKKPEGEHLPESEEESELVADTDRPEEEMKSLSISLPVVRQIKCIGLKPLDHDVIEFYINKNKRRRKDIVNLDSSDQESDSEHSPKRKKISKKLENSDYINYTVPELRQILKKKKIRRSYSNKYKWIDRPYKTIDGYKYYKKVKINESTVSIGDFISTYNSISIGCVKYLFENIDRDQLFHVHWFMRSMDTILAETGHPNELFQTDECEDLSIEEFYEVVSVKFIPTGCDWFETGNMTYVNQLKKNEDPTRFFYYQKRFCKKTARFTDAKPESSNSLFECYNCERERKHTYREIPYSEEMTFDKNKTMFALKMVQWRDEEYHIGSCVFLTPGSIMNMKVESKEEEEEEDDKDYDEDMYPEKYRKREHFKSVQDEDVLSDPFDVGYICAIWSKKQPIAKSDDVKLKVKKFYRPHNTSLSQNEIRKLDLNLLYWSDEECTVSFSKVQGKCYVSYKENLSCSVEKWAQKGPNRFYFSRSYDSELDAFESPSPSAMKIGKLENDDEKDHVDIPKEYPPISRPLRSLDVFAGCGGLTEGLHQAKVAQCCWAIEKNTAAAKAFKLNYPDTAVFTDDCNLLLEAIMNRGKQIWAGQKLPQKGEVEMICGGPPCQGFSGMNRFHYGEWSEFNNSLVVTFLSFCDYYRPRFFVMENVRNFVSYNKSSILKLTLNCLVRMGYQVACEVLQSGCFGIPQSRRRVIILAAAPGESLPLYPEATHTFVTRGFDTISVGDSKYVSSTQWSIAAPYRMITVYDALSDLPQIKAGDLQVERPYSRKPITHFQRQLRTYFGEEETCSVLRDHISKSLTPLVIKRLSFIPKKLGCDWRDLPNIVVKLSDGSLTKKLKYTHHDAKQGKASNGALRGVCCCANNEKCQDMRQSYTIIPWCLPHTSNRHGHWRGLYGRLSWNEYFRTVITNPEPMGKQGRVVHPEDDRVISVKECARSQGFPDRFKFCGVILDKHRQIGNAVAPPLAKAIGLEIRKSIHEKESKVEETDCDI